MISGLYSDFENGNHEAVENWLVKLSPLFSESSEYSLNDAGELIQESNEGCKALAKRLKSKHREGLEKDIEERAQDSRRWLTSKWIAPVGV